MKKYYFILLLIPMIVSSCKIGPQPIDYGTDGCHFCSMTIVDRQHASQIVTDKGKAFKFDAVECMMNHLNDIGTEQISLFLVNDYSRPGELIDATQATYLISQGIPSPMGEFLTAFGSQEALDQVLLEHQGDQLNWEQLKLRFKL